MEAELAKERSVIYTTTLAIGGMSCDACVRHVTRALDGMRGVVHVDVDLEKGMATVEHLPGHTDAAALVAAARDAGYAARLESTVADDDIRPVKAAESPACGCGCAVATI